MPGNRWSRWFHHPPRSEDLQVVVVDLIFQALGASLVESLEQVEVHRITIRHNHSVKDDGHAALLAESGRADLARFAQHNRSGGDEHMLAVVRVDGI